MATFDLEAFVVNPTREVLNVCRKCDLLEIARHFNFPVSATLRVGELREAVLAALVSKEVLALLEPDSFGGEATAEGAVASPVRLGLEGAAATQRPRAASPDVFASGAERKFSTSPVRSSTETSPADVRVRIERLRIRKERESASVSFSSG